MSSKMNVTQFRFPKGRHNLWEYDGGQFRFNRTHAATIKIKQAPQPKGGNLRATVNCKRGPTDLERKENT